MAQKKYKFNPETFKYETIVLPWQLRLYRLLRKILIGFILASIVNFLFSYFFYTPKMWRISQKNNELIMEYRLLESRIESATRKVNAIKQRDNGVYRMLFAADTISIPGVYDNYPESKYASFAHDEYAGMIRSTWMDLDRLARLTYLESRSLDELQRLSMDKEEMSLAIPAIWPIDKRRLRGPIGAYGGRNHPILGKYIMHRGIDLAANLGTPIYATANGTVVLDSGGGTGYGKQILLDHGFGYKTRYAHLNKLFVTTGQKVVRGEVIGEVGNTGRSTAPHLHYEVIYMGQTVNPMNYFRKEMSEEEFEKILQSARETTYEILDM